MKQKFNYLIRRVRETSARYIVMTDGEMVIDFKLQRTLFDAETVKTGRSASVPCFLSKYVRRASAVCMVGHCIRHSDRRKHWCSFAFEQVRQWCSSHQSISLVRVRFRSLKSCQCMGRVEDDMYISFWYVSVLFYFVSLFLCVHVSVYKCLTRNHFIAVCYQCTRMREKLLLQQWKWTYEWLVVGAPVVACVSMEEEQKTRSQWTKK